MTALRRRIIEDMTLRNFAPHTIQVYVERVATFARYFNVSPQRLGPKQIRAYLLSLVQERHVSWSYFNQARCALQFLYRVTLGRDWVMEAVTCPKQQKKLPVVLSLEELVQFFEAVTNLKHRAILMTTYAAGLRLSEVCHLRVDDIDSQRMVIRIRQAKGHKDRYVMLSPRLLALLRQYWKAVQPGHYLFPGADPDRPINPRTVQEACKTALLASGLKKKVTVHTLRHYADSRIMPTEPLLIWFFGPFPGPLASPLAKTTRHNPDILFFMGSPSARKERRSAQTIPSRCISMPACG
jgi:site-specific recombinase XerD